MVYQFIMEQYGVEQLFNILYPLNFILAAIAYKLGFAKKLPILKSIIVYILLAIGIFVLYLLFIVWSVATGGNPLPMTESLVIICLVLAIYRMRLYFQRKAKQSN
ncbi:YlaH-like family protein [Ornithinibacillus scapharcae]|uniref:YlaH-like family protein n=1 Tax=Ornithinibacillus scapharcae TaxID=1147159 RepID=UPI000225B8D2|nr:YlaH-like family protein [Ornithinibacillus scapharcae]